jgi:hypothetical protein
LLAVFDRLIQSATSREGEGSANLVRVGPREYRLKFEEKRRLLTENLYGIDVDFNAVEVAKFSLLVRLLQDETKDTLPAVMRTSILPNLDRNIWCGNTLVRSLPGEGKEQIELTNPLEFSATSLPSEVDMVVGNPPYMKTEDMKKFDPVELDYLRNNYTTAYQQFDKYFPFVEFAAGYLAPRGVIGIVIPNKWMTIVAARALRRLLRTTFSVVRLTNFREAQLFPGKSIYVSSLVAKKGCSQDGFIYSEPASIDGRISDSATTHTVSSEWLPTSPEGAWVLPATSAEEKVLRALYSSSIPLEKVVEERNGVQTSRSKIYVIKASRQLGDLVEWTAMDGNIWRVERAVTRPYLDDSGGIRSHHEVTPDALILFPYEPGGSASSASDWSVIPEDDLRAKYPLAYKYFVSHKDELDKRNMSAAERKKAFYSYGRTQAIGYATAAPKIFYTNNQKGDKYGLDNKGIIFASGGTGGEIALFPKHPKYSLDFVLGLLDQVPIEYFLRKRGSVFRGGYYARGTDVIGDTPVPNLDFTNPVDSVFHDDVVLEVNRLRALNMTSHTISARNQRRHREAMTASRLAVRRLFLNRWGLSEGDVRGLGI